MDHQIGIYFQEQGFTLCADLEEGVQYEFIVDQYLPELEKLPRLYTQNSQEALATPVAFSYFDHHYLEHDPVKYVLQAGLSDQPDFDLLGRFSRDAKNVINVRIQDYLNFGYFVDQVVIEAFKNQFPFEGIRHFLNQSLQYSLGLIKNKMGYTGVEISYTYSTNGFALELAFSMPEWAIDRQLDLYSQLNSSCNCLIVNHFKKRDRIAFSALWFKASELQDFHACFFAEIVGKKRNYGELPDPTNQLDEEQSSIEYDPHAVDPIEARRFHLARKLANFIRDSRMSELEPKPINELNTDDVLAYLIRHPQPELAERVDLETKELILKFLRDATLDEGISEYVESIISSNVESLVNDFTRVLGSKSRQDLLETFVVSGMPEIYEEGFMRVKGWIENMDDETWSVTRNRLVEVVMREVAKAKEHGVALNADNIIAVVAEELQMSSEDIQYAVRSILEEVAASKLLRKEMTQDGFALLLKAKTLEEEQEKQAQQMLKLKDIIEKQREDMFKMREELLDLRQKRVNVEVERENLDMKQTLSKSMESVRMKEEQYLKAKETFDKIVENKDGTIKRMEEKIIELRDKIAKSRVVNNEEKVEQLLIENKNLATKLDLAQSKLNIISDNMDKQKNNDNSKRETLIKHFSAEKSILEEKLKAANLEVKKSEHRLKNALIQLEDLQKGKTTMTQAEKTADYYTKQIEGFNTRITEAGIELSDKKKEIHKLRQENTNLLSKIAELEKKLYAMEKKAS